MTGLARPPPSSPVSFFAGPPLVFREAEADRLLEALDAALGAVERKGTRFR